MSDPTDGGRLRGRVPPRVVRAARAVRVDLARLHAAWMGLAFSLGEPSVVARSRPRTTPGAVGYALWAALGGALLLVAYPLSVLGLATRFYARRIDRLAASIGLVGVVAVSLLAWGALAAATYLAPVAFEGFVAVVVAGAVATGAAVLARRFARRGDRVTTVALAYPFGVTAIFLPPVVASLYSPTLAAVVFPGSESLAIWLLDNVLDVGGLAAAIRAAFDLEGLAYVGMWFGLAVPVGWSLGGLVALANAARPAETPTVEELR